MIVRNDSQYPTDEVRALVKFATSEVDMRKVCVLVKNATRVRSGHAYYYVPRRHKVKVPPSTRLVMEVKVGSPTDFPYVDGYWNQKAREEGKPRRGGRWPEKTLRDWKEAIVAVAAHEAKHIESFKERIRQSEVRCEHFAAYMLNRYRQEML